MQGVGKGVTIAVLLSGFAIASARADEEKIALEKVPAPVLKAFKAKFPDVTIKAAIKEESDGKTLYEIESTAKSGLTVDAVLQPNGEFVEIEKELKADDLPAAVAAAVKKAYPKSKVTKAEELIKGDKSLFELVVETADGKTTEVVVEKSGKIVE
jgi:hypothetical protein